MSVQAGQTNGSETDHLHQGALVRVTKLLQKGTHLFRAKLVQSMLKVLQGSGVAVLLYHVLTLCQQNGLQKMQQSKQTL